MELIGFTVCWPFGTLGTWWVRLFSREIWHVLFQYPVEHPMTIKKQRRLDEEVPKNVTSLHVSIMSSQGPPFFASTILRRWLACVFGGVRGGMAIS